MVIILHFVLLQVKLADVSKDFKNVLELRTEVCQPVYSYMYM